MVHREAPPFPLTKVQIVFIHAAVCSRHVLTKSRVMAEPATLRTCQEDDLTRKDTLVADVASHQRGKILPGLSLEDLRCPICLDFAWSAYQCPNGHVLCRSCLASLPKRPVRNQRVCPTCRVAFEHEAFGRNLVLEHILEEARLPCRNDGCATALPGAALRAHADVCGYRNVTCPGCSEVLLACSLRAHAFVEHSEAWFGPEQQHRCFTFATEALAVSQLASWGSDGFVDYWVNGGVATRMHVQYNSVRAPVHAVAETSVNIFIQRGQPGTIVAGRLELGALVSQPSERSTLQSYCNLRVTFEVMDI
jgi:hypothetical protein